MLRVTIEATDDEHSDAAKMSFTYETPKADDHGLASAIGNVIRAMDPFIIGGMRVDGDTFWKYALEHTDGMFDISDDCEVE